MKPCLIRSMVGWSHFTKIGTKLLHGYKLEFDPDKTSPFTYKRNATEMAKIHEELNTLENKNIIERYSHVNGEFISHIFTRPKKNGGVRLILNLSKPNKYITYYHFKMDNISTAVSLLSEGDFMASVDLPDAYYTVTIHTESRKYLCWQGQLWPFKTLSNGLSSAPRLFTKLLKPVFAFLRQSKHKIVGHLDDTIIIGKTKAGTLESVTAE